MKLYDVPRVSYINIKGLILLFDHLDGAYSYCLDENANVVHVSASEEVEVLDTDPGWDWVRFQENLGRGG